MSGKLVQAARVGSVLIAAVGTAVLLSQAAAALVVVHVMASVVRQMLG